MDKPGFWTSYASAMEMSVEGNRLIAREIVELTLGLWRRMLRSVEHAAHVAGQRRHLPRV